MQRRRMVRLQPVALIEAGNRLLGAPELQQHGGALHGGIPILRREPLELAQGKQRFVEPLALDEKAGEIAPGLRRRGIELHRLVERSQRLVVSSLRRSRLPRLDRYCGFASCRMARDSHSSARSNWAACA